MTPLVYRDPSEDARTCRARRLTLHLGVRDRAGHHSLVVELIGRARQAGMAGATVLEGASGFGTSGTVHRSGLWRVDAPLALVLVDQPERIERYLTEVRPLLAGVLAVAEDVTVHEL